MLIIQETPTKRFDLEHNHVFQNEATRKNVSYLPCTGSNLHKIDVSLLDFSSRTSSETERLSLQAVFYRVLD